ncbi:GDP-mannose 4,6-dehydratase [Methanobrevibacter arboriphilus]|uniref:GDP-mannose 4,6-dehydratase n=1 Tax=Methanobrevibacter arboriphilus TaxID=39441 RepID=UPI0021E647F5|nr:GDP-mannose 4,6-dehydratase [Methanobrevibacter arboriphilus]
MSEKKLYLGNLDASRDWGHAKDYVESMWRILQHKKADDFVVATGKTHTVREFVNLSFKEVGIDLKWVGEGVNEKGIDTKTNNVLVEVDPAYFRPTEVDLLLGDPSKARKKLGWKPKISFNELVREMVQSDLKMVKNDKSLL